MKVLRSYLLTSLSIKTMCGDTRQTSKRCDVRNSRSEKKTFLDRRKFLYTVDVGMGLHFRESVNPRRITEFARGYSSKEKG